jgi:ADP-heptose:LPS heptosyltransferase
MKILAIQFRYFGDAALLTPALRAIKERFPGCELHALVAEEVVPMLQHLTWLERVWAFPRKRGRASLRRAWPVLRNLREQRFERSVDFAGNDRGALVSLLCGARERLGPVRPGGFFGRSFCYNRTVRFPDAPTQPKHQSLGNFQILSAWGIGTPDRPELEIRADPALAERARQLWPAPGILCHLGTSQPKKEWPLAHWSEFHRLASEAGYEVTFSSGPSAREQGLLTALRLQSPSAATLPPLPDLGLFLAVLNRARLFVSGDTGPLHFAAGLGVPTIGLFGPSSQEVWAPLGAGHQALQASPCTCSVQSAECVSQRPCMWSIVPEAVLRFVPLLASGLMRSVTDRGVSPKPHESPEKSFGDPS